MDAAFLELGAGFGSEIVLQRLIEGWVVVTRVEVEGVFVRRAWRIGLRS